jgi:hypothetical protein
MAVHACSPYPNPRFMERSEENDQGGWLGKALEAALQGGARKEAQGFDAAFRARAVKELQRIVPMDWDELTKYSIARGWIKMDKAASKKAGADVFKTKTLSGEEEGFVASVFDTYLLSLAGGTKQMAENFMMKVKAGEDATIEGLQFAKQMQGMSRFGGYVLGWDQSVGRGLRQRGLIRRLDQTAEAMASEGLAPGAMDALGNPGEYADIFKSIAAKLQDPSQSTQGVDELIRLANRVMFLDEPHKISKAALGMEVAGNAWTEVFINGLLSSPATFVTNLMGTIWTPTRALLQYGAAQSYAMTGLAGSKEARIVAAEAGASLAAMQSAFNDAWQIGWHSARTETSLYQKVSKGIHSEAFNAQLQAAGRDPMSAEMAGFIDKLGGFVRLPSRALLGTDEFAKHLAIRGEVAARGVRRAARSGVDLTDRAALQQFMEKEAAQAFDLQNANNWEKYRLDSIYNLQSGVEEAGGRTIAQTAAEATFQEDNGLARNVNKVLQTFPALRPFIPFVRTPLNILKQGVWEGTGMAALAKGLDIATHNHPTKMVMEIQKELLKDPAETFRIAGQITLTTAMAATVYGMAMNGQITGGGPGRWTAGRNGKAAQDAWIAAGNIPYSVKVGDAAIPFDRFGEPLAIVMRMFADLGMHSAYMEGKDQEEAFSGIVGIAASGLYQASFLKGIEIFTKLGQQDNDLAAGQAVQNWFATQTPFGGLLAYVDRVGDPYKGAYEGASFVDMLKVTEDTFGTGIFGKVANRIPGVGGTPQLIDQLTGRPVPVVPGIGPSGLNPLQMAIPLFPRGNDVDPVWKAVYDIKGSYIEKRPTGVKLTPKEQQQLNALMARSTVNGQTLQQRVMAFRQRADVEQYVTNRGAALTGVRTGIEKELDRIIADHFDQALLQLNVSNGDVLKRSQAAEAMRTLAEANDIQGTQQVSGQLDDLYQRALRGY